MKMSTHSAENGISPTASHHHNPFLTNSTGKDLNAVQPHFENSPLGSASPTSVQAGVLELQNDHDNVSLNSNTSRSNSPGFNDLSNHELQHDNTLPHASPSSSTVSSIKQSTPFPNKNQKFLQEQLPRFQISDQPFEPDDAPDNDLDFRYLLASAHLSDACQGLDPQFRPDRQSLRLYCFYQRPLFRRILYALLVIHHSLALFEPITAHDRLANPPSSQLVQYTMLIELGCLSYYALLVALRARFLPPVRFYADRKHLLLLCTLLLTLVDMLLFVAVPAAHARRWSIPLRPLFVINLAENRPVSGLKLT